MRILSFLINLTFKCEVFFSINKKMQTEAGLLENMSMEMEVDDGATATILSRNSSVEPVLRTSPFLKKGRKLCIICFSGAMKNQC